ncbi:ectoine hydrolase DoeA [Motiliproteus sp. MSK22-1]|uniref:ectoine hydrolase DoeA n=1 Tax=Motiliproteus sp. MSK22-1 TaxID=1897630 RepID=UPI0009772149|nr:ectoine hydrolase DoeA [Motiliproteus sp. MSK22-1]OMH38009.1 ectoine hydrolase DoeA [Motiliproteus sp. MSK22-1]
MDDSVLNFSREEFALRLGKVREAMAQHQIDTLIVHDPSNMAWLTGYDGWSFYTPQAVIVGPDGAPVWYGRQMDSNGARRRVYMEEENILSYPDHYVMNPPHHAMEHLANRILSQRGWNRGQIGVEMDNYYFSPTAYLSLKDNLPKAELSDTTGLVNWCRAVKSDREINYMRIAARIVENMHRAVLEMIEPGLPKNKLVGEIYKVAMAGHDGHFGDYPAIVPMLPSGKDASAPHLTWDDTPFKNNEGTFFELAGCHKRYHCPLSRTLFLGEPTADFRRAEEALNEGLEAGLAAAKPGNRCADIADALNDALIKFGFDRGATRCGYPIGLSYPPDWGERTMSLRGSDKTIIKPGMTFHFMPGLWLDDWGIETTESIVITDTGAEPLCNYPRKLFVKN